MRLLARSGGIDRGYLPRALAVSLTTLLTSPLRVAERLAYGRQIARTTIAPTPLFLLGHWRTGTTHLHNLLAHDPQFGFVSTFQGMAPDMSLIGDRFVRPFLAAQARRLHPTREIDNIPLVLEAPQEESFALANLSPLASLHVYSLPRRARAIFRRYGLLEDLDEREKSEWVEHFLHVLRVATLRGGGRPLVLKDPCHTGRIRLLLELFPEARFVHIVRDPYRVLPSMLGVWRVVLGTAQLQEIEPAEVEDLVLGIYEQLMRRYLADRDLIPAGRLVEVRFEDLESDPMRELSTIYDHLGIEGFAAAAPAIRSYAESVRSFVKNDYRVSPEVVRRVNERWRFALDEWGYPRL